MAVGAMGLCQGAWAGSVAYQSVNGRGAHYATISFTAAPGETNDTTLTLTPAVAAVTDPNPLQPDPAYTAETSYYCTFSADKSVCRTDHHHLFVEGTLSLGDGDDRGRMVGGAGTLYGGPGNDGLTGSVAGDMLIGGPGADDIRGGGGLRDWASYNRDGDQTTGVTVTLDDIANDGHPGEHDNVHTDVDTVAGTRHGDNVLIGNAADNLLFGYYGSDVLRGGDGNDQLWGGFEPGPGGANTLDGGPGLDTFMGSDGDDTIHARDGLPDTRITCDAGNDTVEADPNDPVGSDCETVRRG